MKDVLVRVNSIAVLTKDQLARVNLGAGSEKKKKDKLVRVHHRAVESVPQSFPRRGEL